MANAADVSYGHRRARVAAALGGLFILSAALVVVFSMFGSVLYSPAEILRVALRAIRGEDAAGDAARLIVVGIRLPRALLSFFVGAALSVAGVAMQGIFKNPMADPHILGVSSGAALGAALVIIAGSSGIMSIPISAFIGGALAVLLVLSLSRTRGRTNTMTLLLAGIAVNTFLSAVMTGLLTLNHDKMESVYLWTMGSFTAASFSKLAVVAPIVTLGSLLLRGFARDLNLLGMGEEEARMLGVPVRRVRLAMLLISTLITAAAVSFSGVIGFVGLMVPHVVRIFTGPDHRVTLPVSFFVGGIYLMLMDTLARTLFLPIELPVGVLTALVGGPFFLILLKRNRLK